MARGKFVPELETDRRQVLAGLGVAGAVGLAGCAGDGGDGGDTTTGDGETMAGDDDTATDVPTETDTATPAQDYVIGGELIGSFGADVKNFDPTEINDTTSGKAFNMVYESLNATNFGGKPTNNLAKNVEVDGTSVTVTLREGINFHSNNGFEGHEMTAQDVISTFERYKGTTREADVADWYKFGSASAEGDYTVSFELKEKYAPLPFSLGAVPIVPREAASGDLDLSSNPIGTGPYKFVEHDPDNFFRIERNDDYWGPRDMVGEDYPPEPPIETATFRVITEQSAQEAALKGGDIDLANSVPAGSVSNLRDNDQFGVTDRIAGGFDMFVYPMHEEAGTPFQNRKVRLGVNRLIPRPQIVKSVYNGIGIPAYAPISPLAGAFTSQTFQNQMAEEYSGYDVAKAKQQLSEGFEDAGFDMPWETEIIVNQNPQRVQWCQLIQESMNQVQIDGKNVFDVSLNQFEWNTYVGKILAEDSHTKNVLTAVGWSAGFDPDNYVRNLFLSDQATPKCCNINHYQNDQVDELIRKGTSTYGVDARKDIYTELQKLIVEESPMAFIRFGKEIDVFQADTVKGWQTYPINGGEYSGIYAPYAQQYTYVDK